MEEVRRQLRETDNEDNVMGYGMTKEGQVYILIGIRPSTKPTPRKRPGCGLLTGAVLAVVAVVLCCLL